VPQSPSLSFVLCPFFALGAVGKDMIAKKGEKKKKEARAAGLL
jgi:hypothetical protein